jgi:hypothetical protein
MSAGQGMLALRGSHASPSITVMILQDIGTKKGDTFATHMV